MAAQQCDVDLLQNHNANTVQAAVGNIGVNRNNFLCSI